MPHELQDGKVLMSLEHHKVFTRSNRLFMECMGDLYVEWGGHFLLSLIHLDFLLNVSLPQADAFWLLAAEG